MSPRRSARDFRVIAPDARGHGGSEWTRDYSFELMVDDVAGFCEQVGILGAIVVGHSMGALTAYALAVRRPDLIRLLVLEEMPPPDPAKPPRLAASAARAGRRPRLAGGDRVPPLAERTRRGTGGTWPTGSRPRPW